MADESKGSEWAWSEMVQVMVECDRLKANLTRLSGIAKSAAHGGPEAYNEHIRRTLKGYAKRVKLDSLELVNTIGEAASSEPPERSNGETEAARAGD